ncbi:M3 peptidase [Helicosporidium sp. ATCC 50920]|nr:M3 peptidase [Helicosporidium sp. ATCC 50920]|eukprot:KDD76707.1 M3 peptidase [Helicosporidium sp. ATCC 50920]
MDHSRLVSAACKLFQHLHTGLDEVESETIATWRKVVEPLALLYDSYERVTSVFELLAKMNQTEMIRSALRQSRSLTNGFSRRTRQSTALYALLLRIRKDETVCLEHSHEELQALDHWIAEMNAGGASLAENATTLARFNRLDDEETALKQLFVHNVVQGTAAFYLTLRDGKLLRGVPRSALAAMAAEAGKHDVRYSAGWTWATEPTSNAPPLDGAAPTPEWGPWTVTFDPFVYDTMMAYCPDRRIRRIIFQSFENRASQAPWNNVPVVERLLQVRRNKTELLRSAEIVGHRRMAALDKANEFLNAILDPVASAATRVLLRIVRLMAESEAGATTQLRRWDILYWGRRLDSAANVAEKNIARDFSSYFTLSRVLSGAFGLLHRLWGMHVVESVHDKPPVWHPSVRHFLLFNGTEPLGSFFFDPFARPNKSRAPFTQTLVKRSKLHGHLPGKDRTPVVVMSTCIRAPGPGMAALLQTKDVQTIFHEFGRVVQVLVDRNNEVLAAGTTKLPLDFHQMVGQFYELWATEGHTLSMMAQHYKTYAEMTADKRKKLGQITRRKLSKARFSFRIAPTAAISAPLWTPSAPGMAQDTTAYAADALGYFEELGTRDDVHVRALGNKMASELLLNGLENDTDAQYEVNHAWWPSDLPLGQCHL